MDAHGTVLGQPCAENPGPLELWGQEAMVGAGGCRAPLVRSQNRVGPHAWPTGTTSCECEGGQVCDLRVLSSLMKMRGLSPPVPRGRQ